LLFLLLRFINRLLGLLPLFVLKRALKGVGLDGTLSVLDVLLDIQYGREEEVGVLGKGRIFVLGGEEL
jgi:hypothetical protein